MEKSHEEEYAVGTPLLLDPTDSTENFVCPSCTAVGRPGKKICGICGYKSPDYSVQSKQKRCPACQSFQPANADFCDDCGENLKHP